MANLDDEQQLDNQENIENQEEQEVEQQDANDDDVQEEQQEDTQDSDTEDEQTGDEEDDKPKGTRRERRQSRYIKKLSQQLNQERNNRLQSDINNSSDGSYQKLKYDEGDYNVEDLDKDREAYGKQQYDQGMQMSREYAQSAVWQSQLDRDNDYVDQKYKQLNPNDKDNFDADLTDYLNKQFLSLTGFNAKTGIVRNPISYRDYIDGFMEAVDRTSESRMSDSTKRIATQAAKTATRPNANGNANRQAQWTPDQIANMSREEYAKNRDAIMRMIQKEVPQSGRIF